MSPQETQPTISDVRLERYRLGELPPDEHDTRGRPARCRPGAPVQALADGAVGSEDRARRTRRVTWRRRFASVPLRETRPCTVQIRDVPGPG